MALRVSCLRVFRVITPSMEPTIHGAVPAEAGVAAFEGQGVLVAFGLLFRLESVDRFDLVVVDRGDGNAPLTKRVAGLPGERIQLSGGDLLVNGQRLPPSVQRPPGVDLFDWSRDRFEDNFHYLHGSNSDPWSWKQGSSDSILRFEARGVQPGSDQGMALLMRELSDDVRLGNGSFLRGLHQVNDGTISFEVRWTEPDPRGHLRARLVEAGDIFEAELTMESGRAQARLLRYPGGEVLAATDPSVPIELDSNWTRVTFRNRDNRLSLTIASRADPVRELLQIETAYESNRSFDALLPPGLSSIASRAAFGGDGFDADFRNIKITRDQFWIPTGAWGSRLQTELGPNEYFLLGDNSANSLDSRYWGPTPGTQIIGKPIAVIGPWSDRRWL